MSSISWLHCNKCTSNKLQPFFLAKCGHILCKLCGQRAAQPQVCPVCKMPIANLMPLDSKTPSAIANSFKPDVFTEITKALDFQNKQDDAYLQHLKDKCNKVEEAYRQLRRKYDDAKMEGAKLDKELEELMNDQRNGCSNGIRAPGFGGMMDMCRGSDRSSMHFLRQGDISAERQSRQSPPDTRANSLYSMMRASEERLSFKGSDAGDSTGTIPKLGKRRRF